MSGRGARLLLLLLVIVVAVVWFGCSGDKGAGPGCTQPTIDNIWPNEDGRFWAYKVTVNMWDDGGNVCETLYDCEDDPPPLPSWRRIEDLLDAHDIPEDVTTSNAMYRIAFAGDTTSMSGVTAQNLRESLDIPGRQAASAGSRCRIHPFVARLYMARPDLRRVIEDRFGLDPQRDQGILCAENATLMMGCLEWECPLLIHGYVWEKTQDWIGTYGDLDTLLAWKFLDADLSTGHEFTHQLLPSLADDAFLHCKVTGRVKVETDYRGFPNALDCLYIIDYGSWTVTDAGGNPLGCCRTIDYGRVIYVPEVGPVYTYERMLVNPGEPSSIGIGERILTLTDTGAPSR